MDLHCHSNPLQPHTRSERVEMWVKHTQEFHQRNLEEHSMKRKRIPSINEISDIDDDLERYSDDLMIWEKTQTESRKKYRWNQLPLQLRCEWLNCHYENSSIEDFVKHVSYHIPEVDVLKDEKDNDIFICQWNFCGFQTNNDTEFVRHVNYHSYHTKLKCIGEKMTELLNIPKCNINPDGQNSVPDLPVEFSCEWEDCSRVFNNSQMFFFHVASHINSLNGQNSKSEKKRDFPCGWIGCTSKFSTATKLADHLKVHTQEKYTACPSCGGQFSSATKLYDHCMTQDAAKMEYRCTSCFKYFPSERLLRDHMRSHVSRYKCTFCDMTCPSPSSLSLHIRYRHLNSKPFKCYFCSVSMKTRRDLETHLRVHSPSRQYSCPLEGCEFSCRTFATANKHFQDAHCGGSKPLYCCHMCNDRFFKGSQLTKHLFKYHNFHWSSGHSRFTYTRNEDGYFRLKPFRLETLEVTQEILQAEIDEHPASISEVCGSHYSVRQITPIDINEGGKGLSRKRKTIVISIDEIDNTGDVVRREVMETEEVPGQTKGGAVVCNYSDGDGVNNSTVKTRES